MTSFIFQINGLNLNQYAVEQRIWVPYTNYGKQDGKNSVLIIVSATQTQDLVSSFLEQDHNWPDKYQL